MLQFTYTDTVTKPRSRTSDSPSGRSSGYDFNKRLSSVVSSSLIHQENAGGLGTSIKERTMIGKQSAGNQRFSLIGDISSRSSSASSPALSTPLRVSMGIKFKMYTPLAKNS